MFSKIVVPLDHRDDAEAAVFHGAALARQAGARLQLLSVRPTYVDATTVRGRLGEIADRHRVKAELIVLGPAGVAATLAEVAAAPDTLLCLRSRVRGPIAEMTLGSVSEQVVRASHRPVLLIGPRCDPAPERYASMVVGLDGSLVAEQILPTVGSWSEQLDVRPWLFQVLSPHVPLEVGDDVMESGYVHNVAARLADQEIKAEWETAHDRDAAAAIVRFADQQPASFIALTTHGRSGVGRIALGGIAFRVAHRAHSPVLVLRPAPPRRATNLRRPEPSGRRSLSEVAVGRGRPVPGGPTMRVTARSTRPRPEVRSR